VIESEDARKKGDTAAKTVQYVQIIAMHTATHAASHTAPHTTTHAATCRRAIESDEARKKDERGCQDCAMRVIHCNTHCNTATHTATHAATHAATHRRAIESEEARKKAEEAAKIKEKMDADDERAKAEKKEKKKRAKKPKEDGEGACDYVEGTLMCFFAMYRACSWVYFHS